MFDVKEIRTYVADRNKTAAKRIVQRLMAASERLAETPQMGRTGRRKGTREFVVAPYIIAYRVRRDRLEILRVIHGARRWPARL